MNYQQAIEQNLKHMQTPSTDWQAVAIKGMAETSNDKGEAVSMPEFDFPTNYAPAPSLYRNNGGPEMCCELCAHPIKNAYWLQNDKRRWLLLVGSECVTHFEGKSGERLTKEQVWDQNRELLRRAIQLRRKLWDTYTSVVFTGYGRSERRFKLGYQPQGKDYWKLAKLTEGYYPDPGNGWLAEPTSNGSITRWVKKNRETVEEMLNKYAKLMEANNA